MEGGEGANRNWTNSMIFLHENVPCRFQKTTIRMLYLHIVAESKCGWDGAWLFVQPTFLAAGISFLTLSRTYFRCPSAT